MDRKLNPSQLLTHQKEWVREVGKYLLEFIDLQLLNYLEVEASEEGHLFDLFGTTLIINHIRVDPVIGRAQIQYLLQDYGNNTLALKPNLSQQQKEIRALFPDLLEKQQNQYFRKIEVIQKLKKVIDE